MEDFTWPPNICRIMAFFWARFWDFGLFYLLSESRYGLRSQRV